MTQNFSQIKIINMFLDFDDKYFDESNFKFWSVI